MQHRSRGLDDHDAAPRLIGESPRAAGRAGALTAGIDMRLTIGHPHGHDCPGEKAEQVTTLDKVMMPVLDGHPDVFDREWPVRMADIDRHGRLRLDAAARHIQDIGQDQLCASGFQDIQPLWIVRRTMIDVIRPIEFNDTLRLRRWCSATSTRWCEKRVRIDGRKGGLIESEAFWISINPAP